MVQDGKVVGILDWEYAAYFPIWYEYVSASFGFTVMNVEWKKLLWERLGVHDEAYEDAKAFWTDMCNLWQYPDLDDKGQETLKRLFWIPWTFKLAKPVSPQKFSYIGWPAWCSNTCPEGTFSIL